VCILTLPAPTEIYTLSLHDALPIWLLMLGAIQKVDFADLTEAVPALATIAVMLFSYNIANGLTAGLVLNPVFKVLAGRWRELSGGAVALALLCLVYVVFAVPD